MLALRSVFLIVTVTVSLTAAVSEDCENDNECGFSTENSVCVDKTCQCPDGTLTAGDESKCLSPVTGFGAACEDDVQCSAAINAGASCTDNACQCKDGFHFLKGKCWKDVPLNGVCLHEEHCYAGYDFVGITCKEGKCVCRDEYYERGAMCRRKLTSGEICLVDSDCFCDSGKCVTLKCQCAEKPKESRNYLGERDKPCDPGSAGPGKCIAHLGDDCGVDDQCAVSNSICVDERECGCVSGRAGTTDNLACTKVAIEVGVSACTRNTECSSFGPYSVCQSSGTKSVCSCIDGTHYDTNGKLCRVSKLIGETCDVDYDCIARLANGNAKCDGGKCACTAGNHEATGGTVCRPDALEVGDVCTETSDCNKMANVVCDTTLQTCQCAENFFLKDNLCVKGIGGTCSDNSTCSAVDYASCVEDVCTCVDTVPSKDWSTCLPIVEFNEMCRESVQCNPTMGVLKECFNGNCRCQDGSQFLFGRCYEIIKLGGKCKARAECVYPGSDPDAFICQNGICACQYGRQRNGENCM